MINQDTLIFLNVTKIKRFFSLILLEHKDQQLQVEVSVFHICFHLWLIQMTGKSFLILFFFLF